MGNLLGSIKHLEISFGCRLTVKGIGQMLSNTSKVVRGKAFATMTSKEKR